MKVLLSIVLTLLLAYSISGTEEDEAKLKVEVAAAEHEVIDLIKRFVAAKQSRDCKDGEFSCADRTFWRTLRDATELSGSFFPPEPNARGFKPASFVLPEHPRFKPKEIQALREYEKFTFRPRPTYRTLPTFRPFRPLPTLRPLPDFKLPQRRDPNERSPISRANKLNILSPEEEQEYCYSACGKKHIICPENGVIPDESCPKNPPHNDLEDLKDFIVDYHNQLRDRVAGGLLKGLPTASRMGTMEWDHDLHISATYQANLCLPQEDVCYATPKFDQPGQNVGMMSYGGHENRLSFRYIADDLLKQWANRSDHVNSDIIHSFPLPDYNKGIPDYGLFTVMVSEGNTRVGCGINRFEVVRRKHKVIFTCHYAKNNFIGISTYKAGSPTSECNTGQNPRYGNLCSAREKYHLSDLSIEI